MTGAERVDLVGRWKGKPVAFQVLTEDQLRGAVGQAGLPPFVIDAVVSMQVAQAEGAYDVINGVVERLAGQAPRPLQTVLSQAA